LEVAKSKEGIHLCQSKHALDILIEIGMLASNPCTTPIMTYKKILFKVADRFTKPIFL